MRYSVLFRGWGGGVGEESKTIKTALSNSCMTPQIINQLKQIKKDNTCQIKIKQ